MTDAHDPQETLADPDPAGGGGDDTLDAPKGSLPTDSDFDADAHATVLLPEDTASGRNTTATAPQPDTVDEASGGEALNERLIEAAIRRGLITAKQATRVLISPTPALDTMIRSGLLSPEQAQELEEEVRHDFVPGYKLVGELGRGAMGVVYKGIQKSLDRTVAIKVIHPDQASDPQFLQRFQLEAKALARLNHPNIVQVYDHGQARGQVFIALEFVEGSDCGEILEAKGPFSSRDALRVIQDAGLGLSHAHAAGIIHRDIKPANLMLVDRGRDASSAGGSVKVTDLGLARLQSAQKGGGQITAAGTVLGSPAYMSPEQTKGEQADFRSDIYALGATLYHLITGQAPFGDKSALKILSMKSTHQLPCPSDVVPGIEADLILILDRMLAKPREARYQSYEELLADVGAALNGEDPATGPVPRTQSSLLPPQQLPATRKLEPQPAPTAEQPAQDALPPASPLPRVAALTIVLALVGVGAWKGGLIGGPAAAPSPAPPTSPSVDPNSALRSRLGRLEACPDQEVLQSSEDIRSLQSQLAELPAAERTPLESRLETRIQAALDGREQAHQSDLERAYRAGDYTQLAGQADQLTSLYGLLEADPPTDLAHYADLAAQAGRDGAGAREREAWGEASAAKDPLRVLELLAGFDERFPFSPVLSEARTLVREAGEQAPRVVLVPEPADTVLTLDGEELPGGRWEGHLLLGEHQLVARAKGHFELTTTLRIDSERELPVCLGPRPRVALVQGQDALRVWNPRSKEAINKQWDLVTGQWGAAPEVAGLRGESLRTGTWGVARRDATRNLTRISEGAPGWQLQWKLDPPAQGTAELQLLAADDGRLLVAGVRVGEAYLGVRDGDALEVCASLSFDEPPGYYRFDWDGDVAMFHARERRVGSYRPDWTPAQPGVVQVAVGGTEATFQELLFFALVPAGD